MFNILNEQYYLDIDEIENFIQIKFEEVPDFSGVTGEHHISVVRYETMKLLLEVLMGEQEEVDQTLGVKGASHLSIPFKLAFNSLLYKKIIKSI